MVHWDRFVEHVDETLSVQHLFSSRNYAANVAHMHAMVMVFIGLMNGRHVLCLSSFAGTPCSSRPAAVSSRILTTYMDASLLKPRTSPGQTRRATLIEPDMSVMRQLPNIKEPPRPPSSPASQPTKPSGPHRSISYSNISSAFKCLPFLNLPSLCGTSMYDIKLLFEKHTSKLDLTRPGRPPFCFFSFRQHQRDVVCVVMGGGRCAATSQNVAVQDLRRRGNHVRWVIIVPFDLLSITVGRSLLGLFT